VEGVVRNHGPYSDRQRPGAWACRNESLVSPRKDADPTIPILKQAKAEYAKLQ
jgi:hypothetical protein